jgi:hypothetical protein
MGATGSGKSTLLLQLALGDMRHRRHRPEGRSHHRRSRAPSRRRGGPTRPHRPRGARSPADPERALRP